ncbi:MAG: hypothetical protein IT379_18860, partial [Deltaproteobacteria bacterium]|nr:hypothetical protein [Deltaproteobacteria bacterium]
MRAQGRWAAIVPVCALVVLSARASADGPVRGSCLAVTDESVVLVADTEGDALVRVELEQADRTTRLSLPGAPEQVLLLPDGRLAITRRATSRVSAIDPSTLEITSDVELGIEPFGLALAPDGSELYVTDVQSRHLFALDPSDLSQRWVAPLRDDDARGITVSADGRRAYVAHLRAPRISVVDLRRRAQLYSIALPGAPLGARQASANRASSLELSRDGRTLVVAMDVVDPGEVRPRIVCAGYGCRALDAPPPVAGALALLPLGRGARRPTAERIDVLDPTDVRYDPSGNTYWVSGIGMSGGAGRSSRYTECVVPTSRWVVSHHPLASKLRVVPRTQWLCADGDACGDGSNAAASEPREVELGRDEDLFTRMARTLFHVPTDRISRAGLACQTCHPDGRQDGQSWTSQVGRLQTPVLAGRLESTAPYHWHGSARSLEQSIAETVRRLGGAGLAADEAQRLADHLRHGLLPVPRRVANQGDSVAVARGAELFETLGCPRCHDPALAYQDGQRYSMLGTAEDPGEPLDVPSLRSLRLGAPYLHDGRARDLGAVLDGGSMGTRAASLPPRDRASLIAF